MRLRATCPAPNCNARVDAALADGRMPCAACGTDAAPHIGGCQSGGVVQHCPCCGGTELFVRKDFPQRLGLLVVVVAAIVSIVFMGQKNIFAAMISLASVVVIDAVIALCVGKVTVCYRCRAELRGVTYNPKHQPFDLATAEKYPQHG